MLRTELPADDLAGAGAGPFEVEPTPDELRAWRGQPTAAFLIRATVFLAPIVVALVVTVLLIRLLPPPEEGTVRLAWCLATAAVAFVVVMISDRLARRLLPLAALLKLSLVFPDRAPSRFAVARRTATTRQLARRVEEMHARGATDRDGAMADRMPTMSTVELAGASELLALVAALNVHDHLTRGHSERVRALSDMIAEELGLSAADRERLRWAALLHDIGKLAVPAEILNKRGRPTAAEWRIIETHPAEGERLIAGPLADWLGEWARAVGEHHEQFDGSGYPRGLRGEEISLAGRLVAVADAFDVITSHRSYKRPLSAAEARAEITACAGAHFDPVIVRAFLKVSVGRLRRSAGPLTWLAQIPLLSRALFVTPTMSASAVSASAATGTVAALTAGVITFTPALATPVPMEIAAAQGPSAITEVIQTRMASARDAPVVVEIGPESPATATTTTTAARSLGGAAGPDRLAESLRAPSAAAELAPALASPRTSGHTPAPVATTTAAPSSSPASSPTSSPATDALSAPSPAVESTVVEPPPVEPADDPTTDRHDAHRTSIREKLIAKHGECMLGESPPPGGRKCGHDRPAGATAPVPATAPDPAATPASAPAPEHSGPPGQHKVPPGQAKKR